MKREGEKVMLFSFGAALCVVCVSVLCSQSKERVRI
jgi:hypothetical protein